MTPKTADPHRDYHPHKCNRDHPKRHLHIFHPHNMQQWSRELDHNKCHHNDCIRCSLHQRCQKQNTLAENIIRKCNRDHSKRRLHIFHPPDHNHNPFHHHDCLHCPPHRRCQKQNTLTENIIHKCNRDHLKSWLHIFHPHDVRQRSGELASIELQTRRRSGTKGKSNGWER